MVDIIAAECRSKGLSLNISNGNHKENKIFRKKLNATAANLCKCVFIFNEKCIQGSNLEKFSSKQHSIR